MPAWKTIPTLLMRLERAGRGSQNSPTASRSGGSSFDSIDSTVQVRPNTQHLEEAIGAIHKRISVVEEVQQQQQQHRGEAAAVVIPGPF